MFPKLTLELRYGEPGSDFSGRVLMQAGVCAEIDEGEYGEYYGEREEEDEDEDEDE